MLDVTSWPSFIDMQVLALPLSSDDDDDDDDGNGECDSNVIWSVCLSVCVCIGSDHCWSRWRWWWWWQWWFLTRRKHVADVAVVLFVLFIAKFVWWWCENGKTKTLLNNCHHINLMHTLGVTFEQSDIYDGYLYIAIVLYIVSILAFLYICMYISRTYWIDMFCFFFSSCLNICRFLVFRFRFCLLWWWSVKMFFNISAKEWPKYMACYGAVKWY